MGLLKSFFFRAMNSGWYGIIFIIWIGSGLLVCPCVNAQNSPSFIPEMENKKAPVPSTIPAEAIPDQRMEKRLNAIFAEIPDFAEISASVHQGVVQLTGRADSLIDVQEAKKLAERLEGVIFVISDIRIQPEIGIQFAPMFREAYRIAARFALFFPMLFLALIMVFVFWLLGKIIIKWEWPFTHLSQNRLMRHFLRQFISHLLLLVGILLGLHVLGLTAVVGAIVGAAGLIGLMLGFAFKDIVENYLAGFLLSVRSPFAVGDLVEIEGLEGKVVRMTMRELILMTYEGNLVSIPNLEVFKSVLVNYSRNPQRECNFSVGIHTAEDLDHVQEVGCTALAGLTGVIDDPAPFMRVEEFEAYAMAVRFHIWVDQRTYSFRKVRSEAKRILKMALDEAGIRMPPPLQEIALRERKGVVQTSVSRDQPMLSAVEAASRVDVSPEEHISRQIDEEIVRSIK